MVVMTVDETPILRLGLVIDLESDSIKHLILDNKFKTSILNQIYCGRIMQIIPSLEGAFVDIGKSQNAFIRNKDLLRLMGDSFKQGDSIIAQVSKDIHGQKGPLLTSDITIEGHYTVYLPYGNQVKFSKKISDNSTRSVIEKCIRDQFGDDFGVIVRSSVLNLGVSFDLLIDELKKQRDKWDWIVKRGLLEQKTKCLYDTNSFENRIGETVELFSINQVETSSKSFNQMFKNDFHDLPIKMTSGAAYKKYLTQITKLLFQNAFSARSGSSFVIDTLEAFTIVDVNSKHVIGNTQKTTAAFEINWEVSGLIADYIRLINIGGPVLIDYINMDSAHQRLLIDRIQKDFFRRIDGFTVHGFTKLGILELSKKRVGPTVFDRLSLNAEKKDMYFWWLNEMFVDLMELEHHTNTKSVEVEVDSELYSFLRQNPIEWETSLNVKFKANKGKEIPYKFQSQFIDN